MGGGGGNTFWNFRRQGGVETWKPSVVGYGYFLELPNVDAYSFEHTLAFVLSQACKMLIIIIKLLLDFCLV